MSGSYFRRSRTGCVSCREVRIKCDEGQPACGRCEERGVLCGGYPVRLRWMDQPTDDPPKKKASQSSRQKSKHVTVSLPSGRQIGSNSSRSLAPLQCGALNSRARPIESDSITTRTLSLLETDPFGPLFVESLDQCLLDYHQQSIVDIIYMNRSRSPAIQALYSGATTTRDSVMLPVILAQAAAHLSAQGNALVTPVQLYSRKQKALESVRTSLGTQRSSSSGTHLTKNSDIITSFGDSIIAASIGLAGIEITLGADYNHFISIIVGTANLVKQRRDYASRIDLQAPSTQSHIRLDSPLFILSQKMLAYFDVASSVPCARPPILDQASWLTDPFCLADTNIDGTGLDPTFGCFAIVLGLTSDSASLLHSWFTGAIPRSQYLVERESLRSRLRAWKPTKPSSGSINNKASFDYSISVSAGRAHNFATQIYLLRSIDVDVGSEDVISHVEELRKAIRQVPSDSPPVTTMLWPLWVLGCESFDDRSRQEVEHLIEAMLKRQRFMNINTCLQTLRARIWTLGPHEQASWVRFCWDQEVRLILA